MEKNKKSFWDLDNSTRNQIVRDRFRNSKYVVWDYAPSIEDNSFGTIEELGEPIDRGFVHGFVIRHSKVVTSHKWDEFNVYGDGWYLDEEFENRTLYPYHFFSDYEKALEYSKKVKEYNAVNHLAEPTLEDILPIIKKYDKSFKICVGKRGNESYLPEYSAISNGTCTTFTIDSKFNIYMSRGSMNTGFIITHIDLLDKVLDMFYNGEYRTTDDKNNSIAYWAIMN